jgi:hypothetical protein
MYSINQYPSAVIDKSKIKSFQFIKNMIIVFSYLEFNNETEYYFIHFDYTYFLTNFNERQINLARGYSNVIIDIPIRFLKKIIL